MYYILKNLSVHSEILLLLKACKSSKKTSLQIWSPEPTMNLGVLSFNSSSDTYWLAVRSWWQVDKGQRVCSLHKVSTPQASCYWMARKWLLRLFALQFGVHQITDLKIPSRASGSSTPKEAITKRPWNHNPQKDKCLPVPTGVAVFYHPRV